jgi:hypothetical protein
VHVGLSLVFAVLCSEGASLHEMKCIVTPWQSLQGVARTMIQMLDSALFVIINTEAIGQLRLCPVPKVMCGIAIAWEQSNQGVE